MVENQESRQPSDLRTRPCQFGVAREQQLPQRLDIIPAALATSDATAPGWIAAATIRRFSSESRSGDAMNIPPIKAQASQDYARVIELRTAATPNTAALAALA
jgi:hypothetical protein